MKKIGSRALMRALGVAAFAAAVMLAVPASATLIGDNIDMRITFDHSNPNFPTPAGYTADDVSLAGVLVQDTSGPPELQVAYFGNILTPSGDPTSFGVLTVDVDASAILLAPFGGTSDPSVEPAFIPPFELWLEGLEWVGVPGTISGVTVDLSSDILGLLAGLTVSDFGTDGVSGESFIHINFPGIDAGFFPLFGLAFLNIETAHGQVPEPATLALFAIGLAGLGFARRKRMT